MTASPWTPDLAEEAKRMYGQEGLSVAVVARSLNTQFGTHFSRNAVMAKLDRLGLIGRGGVAKPKVARVPERAVPVIHDTKAVPVNSKKAALALEPLGPVRDFPPKGTCHFMTGDPQDPDWRMCGRDGYPWCKDHLHVVVDKVIPAIKDKKDCAT